MGGMDTFFNFSEEYLQYLKLLAREYPTKQATFTELINLMAILHLPKGTEHFMSDLHGEYDAFAHILNNCSGVIREKVQAIYGATLSKADQSNLCTLIYYPKEKLARIQRGHSNTVQWYKTTLTQLIDLTRFLSSKYTRSKVRKAIPDGFVFIIDELIHAQPDEDNNRMVYHAKVLDSIIETGSADDFICALAALIKRLAVDRLHIVGDIFDRGAHADRIMDKLMRYHSLDIQWGNHDILWMGAAAGSEACIATVLRNNIKYNNLEILEGGYGISLRPLALYAHDTYRRGEKMSPLMKAISVLLFKVEGQTILRHPEYDMQDRLLLDKVNLKDGTIQIEGKEYKLNTNDFPTIDPEHPYELNAEEQKIMDDLVYSFRNGERLQKHIGFLYTSGSMYRLFNDNLLFHGDIPLDADGNFQKVNCGGHTYQGRAYLDYADRTARRAFNTGERNSLDFMYFLWCNKMSPVSGRVMKTFERTYIDDKSTWKEPEDLYNVFKKDEKVCRMILHEFGLYSDRSHIINGHTPVKVSQGESPVRANGKLLVIDGGFSKPYQKTTGIAGYTLIFNSHGLRIKSHHAFTSVENVLDENADIDSETEMVEVEPERVMVEDTDDGKTISTNIRDLNALLYAYRSGLIQEKLPKK
jgi:fructose-1,6-bisphosphatase-3